ncbi:hypothetical protein ACEWMW_05150 [Altererythrobacter sp. MF3-039]
MSEQAREHSKCMPAKGDTGIHVYCRELWAFAGGDRENLPLTTLAATRLEAYSRIYAA